MICEKALSGEADAAERAKCAESGGDQFCLNRSTESQICEWHNDQAAILPWRGCRNCIGLSMVVTRQRGRHAATQ
jgi:hypothetical protein